MNIWGGARGENRPVCRFYQRGMCRFGNRCHNLHHEARSTGTIPRTIPKPRSPEKNSAKPVEEHITTVLSGLAIVSNTPKSDTSPGTSSSADTAASQNTSLQECSTSKSCGICFDAILEKKVRREQTFGILPNCNHCFCFACIRKWRQSKEFEHEVSKACPECRKPSDFVYPSKIWFEVQEQKDIFITSEKARMQKLDCRYFRKGHGSCPFGNTCLYLHALPNGKKMDVGPPKPRRKRNSSQITADMLEAVSQFTFWFGDEDFDIDDDDDEDDIDDFELDLDDPLIAMQYYDHDDIRRYIAMDRLFNESDVESDDDDIEYPIFL